MRYRSARYGATSRCAQARIRRSAAGANGSTQWNVAVCPSARFGISGMRSTCGGSDPALAVLKPHPAARARVVVSQLAKSGKKRAQ